jgi:amicyanin
MSRVAAVVTGLAVVVAVALLVAGTTSAGPEKIQFPAKWESFVKYATLDRHDNKQYRELYASSQEAVDAMKAGKPLPDGTVLVLIPYEAQVDAQGNPVKDANGRFVKGKRLGVNVMEKRSGFGTEYPADLRNGDWEYAVFSVDGKLNEKANYKGCFQCHKPHEAQDYVISLASLKGGTGKAASGAGDVTIAGFAFGPGKLAVAPGKAVTWVNNDDSPHQITVTSGTQTRGPVMTKGQSYSQSFSTPGTYDYICGLHPTMKGQVEVK